MSFAEERNRFGIRFTNYQTSAAAQQRGLPERKHNFTRQNESPDPTDFFLPRFVREKMEPSEQPTDAQIKQIRDTLQTQPLGVLPYSFGQRASAFIEIFETALSLSALPKQDPQKAIVLCLHMDLDVVAAIRRLLPEEDHLKTVKIYSAMAKLVPFPDSDLQSKAFTFRKQKIWEPYALYGENLRRQAMRCCYQGQVNDLVLVRVFVRGILNEEARRLLQYSKDPPKNLRECYEQLQRSIVVFPHFGILRRLQSGRRQSKKIPENGRSWRANEVRINPSNKVFDDEMECTK